MTFKISTRPRIRTSIPLLIEVEGEQLDNSFGATFRILPLSQMGEEQANNDAGQIKLLTDATVDLHDIADDAGQPVPFTPELLAGLLDRSEVRVAMIKAYYEAARKAASGN